MATPSRRSLPSLVCALMALAAPVQATVFIAEFMADNQTGAVVPAVPLTGFVDENGDHSDWLELWNDGPAAVNLNGWYLTDNPSDLRAWRFPVTTPVVSIPANGRLVIFASNKDRKLFANKLHTSFRLNKAAGSYLALIRPDGITVEHGYTSYPQQVQDIGYGLPVQTEWQPLVPAGAAGRAKVPLSAADMPVTAAPVTSADWRSIGFNDATWQQGATGFGYDTANSYGTLIGAGGNLQASMHLVNSTAMIRIPFTVNNLGAIAALRLQMKYDDGFIAYVNGNVITGWQFAAPGAPMWNSSAITDRGGNATLTYQIFNSSVAHSSLVSGTNVLAIHLLNRTNGSTQDTDTFGTANGSRTLALPFLEASVSLGVRPIGYLASATPNNLNSDVLGTLGPLISKTTDEVVTRPTGDAASAPIVVSAKVVQSLKPLKAVDPVKLKYRIMYGAETTVVMRDNGVAPDAIAGDAIFTAQLPTANAGLGKMIRWKVEATDNGSPAGISNDPPFRDIADNDQYYGTVTQDGITTSALPVLHWFADPAELPPNTYAAATDGGTRKCSLYFLGRFYDNVFANLHGQSSRGFSVNKKSHNFNFNEDNRFTWKDGEDRQRALNLITTWADKSHVRDTLSWESWKNVGHIAAHWAQLVRVQQNGAFFGIYDMVENGDEDFIARNGLDPQGALYKCYNSLDGSTSPGVEKKTRDFEGNADLQALITAMSNSNSVTSRRQYGYDNLDIPALVNYLATNVLLINNDFGHKNYYIYRDSDGTREWSVLPWDQDLSIGHTWTGVQNYFNDDIHSQAGLVLGASEGNRVMNLIMRNDGSTSAPEMVRMFMRRLRTLMDSMLISANATDGPFEQRINQMLDSMDPPGAAFLTDADLDLRAWGYWEDGSGAQILAPGGDAATHDHGIRRQALRIMNSNPNPPNPTAAVNAEGLGDTRPPFLMGRRATLFNGGLVMAGQTIPSSQPASPSGLVIEHVDFNPGTQTQEFFIIRNNTPEYIDISGWKITGAVSHTFFGGTVIPPFTANSAFTATGDVHNGRLHVARDAFQFRQRTASPKGNEFRLVVGGYSGQLSARGETINLVKPGATPAQDVVIASTTFAGAPTPTQNFLRVTELAYNPAGPSSAETTTLPGVQPSDFEFIELANTSGSALNLGGASFDRGITFTFPAGFTLQAGERCVVVSLLSAFNLRHGAAGANVAGQYEGNLSNSGETLHLLDISGESILEFAYDPLWYGVPDPLNPGDVDAVQGRSLVTRSGTPGWDSYDAATTWALAATAGGTPGGNDTQFASVFIGWRKDFFSSSEEATPALTSLLADPDGDGLNNAGEYAYGRNPRVNDSAVLNDTSLVNVGGTDYLATTFTRRRNALDLTYTVEVSGDLATWTPVDLLVGTATDLGNGLERVTYRDDQPATDSRFIRVRAVK